MIKNRFACVASGLLLGLLAASFAATQAFAAASVPQPDMWVHLAKPPAVAPGGETRTTVTWGCQANSAAADGGSMVHERVEVWAPRRTRFNAKKMLDQPGSWWTSGDATHMVMQSSVTTFCWRPGYADYPNTKYQQPIYLQILRSAEPGSVLHDLTAKITQDYGIQDESQANNQDSTPVSVAGSRPRPRAKARPATAAPTVSPSPSPSAPTPTPTPTAVTTTSAPPSPAASNQGGDGRSRRTAGFAALGVTVAATATTFLLRRRRVAGT